MTHELVEMPMPELEIQAAVILFLAIIHTFSTKKFQTVALRFKEGTVLENIFHLLGEVEIVFGLWAGVFIVIGSLRLGAEPLIIYLESLNFTEPLFVFVIMVMASTLPVLEPAGRAIVWLSRGLRLPGSCGFYIVLLIVGPLLGSLITEPAAMTITALIARDAVFSRGISDRLKYVTLATLFVNVSIGGVLTHFAAPPVLMVAGRWGWDLSYVFTHFGWKAVIAVVLNVVVATMISYRELRRLSIQNVVAKGVAPGWLSCIHLIALGAVVATAHHLVVFMGIFLFFIGLCQITSEYQSELKTREGLLVGFFLAGLVVLGTLQSWWLSPLLAGFNEQALFFGAAFLTAIVDNAALTYLAAQVADLSDAMKYFVVAGAVAGGGLTVIANAPNPAGYSILNKSFGASGISSLGLLGAALVPTIIAMATFALL